MILRIQNLTEMIDDLDDKLPMVPDEPTQRMALSK